jgi:hypothetical protein
MNLEAHGYTIVVLHSKVLRVLYFLKEWKCISLLASSPKMKRGKVAWVARFSKDIDLKIR